VAVTDRPEPSHAGVVDQVQTDGVTIDLKAAFPVVANGTPAAKPQPGIEVKSVRQFSTTVTLEGDPPFVEGDVVCRPAAALPTAAVIDSVKDKRIVLSQPLEGLVKGDTITSAAFPDRTTVTSAPAGAGPSIHVGSTASMVKDDLLFLIGEDGSLQSAGAIERVAGTTVELRGAAVPLQEGDVVGVARASASGEVLFVSEDGLEADIKKLGEFRVGDPVSIQGARDGTVSVVSHVTPQASDLTVRWRA